MVIFLNLDGSCENVSPGRVFQGSNNVTDVTVVAPFPADAAVQIGFILPNGLYLKSAEGATYFPMNLMQYEADNRVNVWRYTLPNTVTALAGDVNIAINVTTQDGVNTSYMCKQVIEESILPEPPTAPTQSVYDLILLYLSRLNARTADVPNLVKSIQKTAANAFTYTTESGAVSAPIVLDGADGTSSMPLTAASKVILPDTAWQPIYSGETVTGYTTTVTAAMHGQMRDGATANDLWVSFDETDDGVISGIYQGYTVDTAGNITIQVTQPIAITVRVWNGKGAVDLEARASIAQEQERAEAAEKNLQEQIDEIEQSGVDKIAREQIAAEIARAEAAEVDLQAQITAETDRATTAENVLTSDIEGLREDINNEAHFRGMFSSVEALRAAYPTATPNDYAYIIGGNIWLWQDGAWTDSEKPSPNAAVPLSDSTPLMDGVASAGTASEGARSDHRHPSDTNKVNKSGDTMSGELSIEKSSGETMFRTKRIDTGNAVALGIGSGGVNRGVYDPVRQRWIVHVTDTNAVRINDKVSVGNDGELYLQHNQQARGFEYLREDNPAPNALISGFYNGLFSKYSKYVVAGDVSERLVMGWEYEGNVGLHVRVTLNENWQYDYKILDTAGHLLDNGQRVYSPNNPPPLVYKSDISVMSNSAAITAGSTYTLSNLGLASNAKYKGGFINIGAYKVIGFILAANMFCAIKGGQIIPGDSVVIEYPTIE